MLSHSSDQATQQFLGCACSHHRTRPHICRLWNTQGVEAIARGCTDLTDLYIGGMVEPAVDGGGDSQDPASAAEQPPRITNASLEALAESCGVLTLLELFECAPPSMVTDDAKDALQDALPDLEIIDERQDDSDDDDDSDGDGDGDCGVAGQHEEPSLSLHGHGGLNEQDEEGD